MQNTKLVPKRSTPLPTLAHHALRVLGRFMHVVPVPPQCRPAPCNVKQLLRKLVIFWLRNIGTLQQTYFKYDMQSMPCTPTHWQTQMRRSCCDATRRARTFVVTRPPLTRSVFCTVKSRPEAYAALILWYCMTMVSGMSIPPWLLEAARIS